MSRRRRGLVPLVATTVLSLGACLAVILADYTPLLGLDLQGGVSVVLQPVKAGKKQTKVSAEALEQTQRVIETRVNAIGVGEPDITVQGTTIVVQLPGIKDQQRVLDLVGKTAELRFRPVVEAPTGAPPKNASQQIRDLREELKIPDGVSVDDILAQEQAATTEATASTDPAAETPTTTPGPSTTIASGTIAPTTAAPTTAAPTTAADGEGSGGGRSLKGASARRQATTTTPTTAPTTAAGDTTAPTTAAGTTTTTAYVSKNEWKVDVTSSNFQKLYTLAQQVKASKAEITPPEKDVADQPVTLLGEPDENGERVTYKLGPTLLTGRAISGATAGLVNGQWVVNPVFRDGKNGIDLFNQAAAKCNSGAAECPPTAGSVGALAIVLDGVVISAPAINEASFQKDQIQISGSFTEQSANDLALALRYGSLPLELEPQTVQTVSATLGSGALRAGVIAGLIGLGIVIIYIIAYYRLLGLITVGGLLLTAAILWAAIGFLGKTSGLALTLAGIVGIIVSIGVSLDSSVVYFENLKEDVLHSGRTFRSAVDRSFDQAWGTIIKADVSSLIGAVILYLLSVGPVKGFAFYLALSTVIDLLLAYLFIRPAVVFAANSSLGRRPALFGVPAPPLDETAAVRPVTRAARTAAAGAVAAGAAAAPVDDEPEPAVDDEPEPEPEPDELIADEPTLEADEADEADHADEAETEPEPGDEGEEAAK